LPGDLEDDVHRSIIALRPTGEIPRSDDRAQGGLRELGTDRLRAAVVRQGLKPLKDLLCAAVPGEVDVTGRSVEGRLAVAVVSDADPVHGANVDGSSAEAAQLVLDLRDRVFHRSSIALRRPAAGTSYSIVSTCADVGARRGPVGMSGLRQSAVLRGFG